MRTLPAVLFWVAALAWATPSVSRAQIADGEPSPPTSASALPPVERPDFANDSRSSIARLPKNTLTTNPLLYAISSTYTVEYERVLNRSVSAFVAPTFVALSQFQVVDFGTFKVRAGGLTLGARYYFYGEAPRGLFGSAFGSLLLGTMSFAYNPDTGNPFFQRGYQAAAGLVFGYSMLIADRFPISVGLGYEGTVGNIQLSPITGVTVGGGFVLRINVGYAF